MTGPEEREPTDSELTRGYRDVLAALQRIGPGKLLCGDVECPRCGQVTLFFMGFDHRTKACSGFPGYDEMYMSCSAWCPCGFVFRKGSPPTGEGRN